MKFFSRLQIHELLIYIVLWLIVFSVPLLDSYSKFSSGLSYAWQWTDVFKIWIGILPFFFLFLVHELFLIPYYLLRKKYLVYILFSIFCLGIFSVAHEFIRPSEFDDRPRKELKNDMRPLPTKKEKVADDMMYENNMLEPPHRMDDMLDDVPPMEPVDNNKTWSETHKFVNKRPHDPEHIFPLPPFFLSTILAILMLGLNLGIKFIFKSMRDEEVMKELERQNLAQELEYLKYQINPHFFMNTLNNIHALIDIDTEKAKSTIIELSKLMRYVLYDSSYGNISLEKEIEFLKHYIALMRLRYSDKVKININFPENVGKISVPPLLFVSFVENAFKHGISYQHDSFINISLTLKENEMSFSCVNSKHSTNNDPASGIGLENVKKRLQLLYGSNYLLNIDDKDGFFKVLLIIPITI